MQPHVHVHKSMSVKYPPPRYIGSPGHLSQFPTKLHTSKFSGRFIGPETVGALAIYSVIHFFGGGVLSWLWGKKPNAHRLIDRSTSCEGGMVGGPEGGENRVQPDPGGQADPQGHNWGQSDGERVVAFDVVPRWKSYEHI